MRLMYIIMYIAVYVEYDYSVLQSLIDHNVCICLLDFSFVCNDFIFCAPGLFHVRRCISILLHYITVSAIISVVGGCPCSECRLT